jgi:ZIP family zinc transporter
MSFAQTAILGAIAGSTIFLGLPAGRIRSMSKRVRVALAMFSVGVLAFIFVDVTAHGMDIAEAALIEFKAGDSSFGHFLVLLVMLLGGFAAGSAGLAVLERRLRPESNDHPPIAGGADAAAFTPEEVAQFTSEADAAKRRALQTGMVIAAAIGVHNFAEGLAIGVSAQSGEIALATVLIIGFALHNATEGFGIVGPLANVTPSWGWLGLAGVVGGAPTFLGAMVGYKVTSEPLELAFYAVAAGAILYVIGEIWHSTRRYGFRELGLAFASLGFAAGLLTDFIVVYGGG